VNWLGCGVQVWGSWFDCLQRQQSHLFSESSRVTLRPLKVSSSSGKYYFIRKCKKALEWSWSLASIYFRFLEGVELNLHSPVSLHDVQVENFNFLLVFIIRTFLLSNYSLKTAWILCVFLFLPKSSPTLLRVWQYSFLLYYFWATVHDKLFILRCL